MAAIEEEHHRALGNQRRKSSRCSRRIRQLKFLRNRSRHHSLADRHGIILSNSGAGENQRLSGTFVVHSSVRTGKVKLCRHP